MENLNVLISSFKKTIQHRNVLIYKTNREEKKLFRKFVIKLNITQMFTEKCLQLNLILKKIYLISLIFSPPFPIITI